MKSRQSKQNSVLWTVPVFALFAALGGYGIIAGKPSDRVTDWMCLGIFGSLAVITLGWEIGRKFQGNGAGWTGLKIEGVSRPVWLWRTSKLQSVGAFLMLLLCGVAGLTYCLFKVSTPRGWEMGIAGVIGVISAAVFGVTNLGKAQGVGLLPSGLLWLKGKDAWDVPWDAIHGAAVTRVAQDVGHGIKTTVPALGVQLNPEYELKLSQNVIAERCPLTPDAKARLQRSTRETGFPLIYLGEALLMPLDDAVAVLNCLVANPKERSALAPEQAGLGAAEALLKKCLPVVSSVRGVDG